MDKEIAEKIRLIILISIPVIVSIIQIVQQLVAQINGNKYLKGR